MRIFVDTEFTDLWAPELISVGLATQCDARLYVEIAPDPAGNTGWIPAGCSRFVRESVIPLLHGGRFALTRQAASERILTWLESFPDSIELVADSAVDFHMLHALWGDARKPRNLIAEQVTAMPRGRALLRNDSIRQGLRRHHALDDAIALMRGAELQPALPA